MENRRRSRKPRSIQSESQSSSTVDRPYLSIDVECVLVEGGKHAVGQIALVDYQERLLLNIYVKPDERVINYLTPVSGLTKNKLNKQGFPFEEALHRLRQCLPKRAILVGQGIKQDIKWLELQQGIDFHSSIDLGNLLKVHNPETDRMMRTSLHHLAVALLGAAADVTQHNALTDALWSIQVYKCYLQNKNDPVALDRMQRQINDTPKPDKPQLHKKQRNRKKKFVRRNLTPAVDETEPDRRPVGRQSGQLVIRDNNIHCRQGQDYNNDTHHRERHIHNVHDNTLDDLYEEYRRRHLYDHGYRPVNRSVNTYNNQRENYDFHVDYNDNHIIQRGYDSQQNYSGFHQPVRSVADNQDRLREEEVHPCAVCVFIILGIIIFVAYLNNREERYARLYP